MTERGSYLESLRRLYAYETSPRLGLSRIKRLLGVLGNPQDCAPAYHVTGTNGKGSTSFFISTGLVDRGLKVGLITSPHLYECRERIRINNCPISYHTFTQVEALVEEAAVSLREQPSFFERITAMAFVAFQNAEVDRIVAEVGLGGRLDATNVVKTKVHVFTPIALDHCDRLGSTYEAIAMEKVGIVRSSAPMVSSAQRTEVEPVLQKHAKDYGCSLSFVDGLKDTPFSTKHEALAQTLVANASLSASALNTGEKDDRFELDLNLAMEAKWPCRFVERRRSYLLLLDGAHNAHAAREYRRWCETRFRGGGNALLVFGASKGHHSNDTFFALLAELSSAAGATGDALNIAHVILVRAQHPRSCDPDVLREEIIEDKRWGLYAEDIFLEVGPSIAHVVKRAENNEFLEETPTLLVTGSLFVAAEYLAAIDGTVCDSLMPMF